MRNIRTKSLKTAMNNIACRIRTDLVMQVAFVKSKYGGHIHIWVTEAGGQEVLWKLDFPFGRMVEINLPKELTTEKE